MRCRICPRGRRGNSMNKIAIIPARGGSKRLPRKNILPFMGRPMISHPIDAAKKSDVFDAVVVSSDDDEINAIAEESGARIIIRPDDLATDEVHELDAVKHVLQTLRETDNVSPELFCVIYPTAVLIRPEDFQKSVRLFYEGSRPDVVMSVSSFNYHPYKALKENDEGYLEMLFPEECKMRSQLYPHLVASNGTFYWFDADSFDKNPTYYAERLKAYELPYERAPDIDTEEDYENLKVLANIKC